jgi:hypothetical protein
MFRHATKKGNFEVEDFFFESPYESLDIGVRATHANGSSKDNGVKTS